MRAIGAGDIRCAVDTWPVDLNEIRLMQLTGNLLANVILLLANPARHHLLPDGALMVAEIGRPEFGSVEAWVGGLLRAIPLREILTHILTQLHAMCFGVAGVARQLLRQFLELARSFRVRPGPR